MYYIIKLAKNNYYKIKIQNNTGNIKHVLNIIKEIISRDQEKNYGPQKLFLIIN